MCVCACINQHILFTTCSVCHRIPHQFLKIVQNVDKNEHLYDEADVRKKLPQQEAYCVISFIHVNFHYISFYWDSMFSSHVQNMTVAHVIHQPF